MSPNDIYEPVSSNDSEIIIENSSDNITENKLSNVVKETFLLTDKFFYSDVNNEYRDKLLNVSDDILALPTSELLNYFLESEFMQFDNDIYSSEPDFQVDCSWHEAFQELITRSDLLDVLEIYSLNINQGSKYNIDAFKAVLGQKEIEKLISDTANASSKYPELISYYLTESKNGLGIGDFWFRPNNIAYVYGGAVESASGIDVDFASTSYIFFRSRN